MSGLAGAAKCRICLRATRQRIKEARMAKLRRSPVVSVARSINGLSVYGISWKPPVDKRRIVKDLITYLEAKRVLYVPYDMEFGLWANESVLQIREELTKALKACPSDDELTGPIREMRAACLMFLDLMGSPTGRGRFFDDENMWVALGQLRGIFRLQLAELSVVYGVEVEGELVYTIPFEIYEEE
jgi:hypothetical protein